jgi:hypothetical protein
MGGRKTRFHLSLDSSCERMASIVIRPFYSIIRASGKLVVPRASQGGILDYAENKSEVTSLKWQSQAVSSCSDSSKTFLLSQYISNDSNNAVYLNE